MIKTRKIHDTFQFPLILHPKGRVNFSCRDDYTGVCTVENDIPTFHSVVAEPWQIHMSVTSERVLQKGHPHIPSDRL